MKVLYVMVFVLLAVALPCHGRTESLGTVFNKTQPHESMNNVTVSSSKLEAYGFLFLVMRWPRSFCHFNRNCLRPAPGRFTVHGLWPQAGSYSRHRGVDCSPVYGRYRPFNIQQLNFLLMPNLNTYWPDLNSYEISRYWDKNNHLFWKREYKKHGSCTFNDQNLYFSRTLVLVQQLGRLIVDPSQIRGGGIHSGNIYQPSYIRDAVYRATQKTPILRCFNDGHFYYLFEIYFCADRDSGRLRDCDWDSNCGYETVNRVRIL